MRLDPFFRAATNLHVIRLLKPLISYRLNHRLALLKQMPQGAHCAEIGVWKGDFSRQIIKVTKPRVLHLVDPWEYQPQYPKRMYGGTSARNQSDMDEIFKEVQEKFARLDNVRVRRSTSRDFFQSLSENLDWVYIDGDHSADAVLQDLEMSRQSVNQTGVIAGDDYNWTDSDGSLSVKKAVDQFCSKYDYRKKITGSQFMLWQV